MKKNFSKNFIKKKNQDTFTHFVSLPFIQPEQKQILEKSQTQILNKFSEEEQKCFHKHNQDLAHITIVMLALPNEEKKQKALGILKDCSDFIKKELQNMENQKLNIELGGLDCFRKKARGGQKGQVTILFQKVIENDTLNKISDKIIRELIKEDILNPEDENFQKTNAIYDHRTGIFKPSCYHMTLFRMRYENSKESKIDLEPVLEEFGKENLGIHSFSSLDISTRFHFAEDKFYLPLIRLDLDTNKKEEKKDQIQSQQIQEKEETKEEEKQQQQ